MNRREFARTACCLILAIVVWWLPPIADDLPRASMHLLAVFVGVILMLIVTDHHISVVCGVAMVVLALSRQLVCRHSGSGSGVVICSDCNGSDCDGSTGAFEASLAGFANEVNWLVFAAFHLGAAVEVSGLGRRVSLYVARWLGGSLLGLAYAVVLSECLLGAVVPSNTARGGGIMMPIVMSMCRIVKDSSTPEISSSGDYARDSEFLVLCGVQANLLAASLYQTGMAANPLVSAFALKILGVEFGWLVWLAGSCVPALAIAISMPYVLMRVVFRGRSGAPIPSLGDLSWWRRRRRWSWFKSSTGDGLEQLIVTAGSDDSELQVPTFRDKVSEAVERDLLDIGPMSRREMILAVVLALCFVFWATKPWTGLDASLVAFAAVMVLVLMQVLPWSHIVGNHKAWDTFFWLGILIMIADQLTAVGLTAAVGVKVASGIGNLGVGAVWSSIMLGILYFYSMYLFSSLTGHIVAIGAAFLQAAKALNCPPMLVTALIAYLSTVCGCLTNFSSGPVVIYFSQGLTSRVRWFAIGAWMGVYYLIVYLTVGMLWWRVLGWW